MLCDNKNALYNLIAIFLAYNDLANEMTVILYRLAPVSKQRTFSKLISQIATRSTRYLLSPNSSRVKRGVSGRLLPRAVIHDTLVYTRHSLPLQHCRERHWMATGSSPRASRKLITSIAPAPRCSGREKSVNILSTQWRGLNPLHQSIMRSRTAKKKKKINPFI